jgi:uncharacterized protein YbgA (DUF1722 family)/uncharacterized protein YbbK (DUF523 family)
MEDQRIKLGISSCLLGAKVRYDGKHRLNPFLKETLGQFVKWIPVCPEVECGLPVPREAMQLVGYPMNVRLLTIKKKVDYTDLMKEYTFSKIPSLREENLSGFIFKSKSPSSGMQGVDIYNSKGQPEFKGTGLFAEEVMCHFPLMPVEDDTRLHNSVIRENFIERIFVYKRWRELIQNKPVRNKLIEFHTRHKFLIMAHSPSVLIKLGNLVAWKKEIQELDLYNQYISVLMKGLKVEATLSKNVNVIEHLLGYLKKNLNQSEKQEFLEIVENYQQGLIPLIVPLTLIRHYGRKYKITYLNDQYYLNPHPAELMLRNHA